MKAPARGYDVGGAVAITLGMLALVFTLLKANSWGWGSGKTIAGFALAAVLIAVVRVDRAPTAGPPLVPLRIFSNRSLAAVGRGDAAGRSGVVRDVLLLHAVSAAGPWSSAR